MPLCETEALVLRTYRLGEADKIVSLLTRQFGRLRAVAAGAQRPKSRYGGTLEPLSYVRLWIFERENRDLLRINSAELAESFFSMQKDYRIQIAAQYVAEAAEKFLPDRETNDRVFRLLLAVLRAIKRTGEVNRPLIYFNYWLLRLGGFLPDFGVCASCGAGLETSGYYAAGAHGLACGDCQPPRDSLKLSVSDLKAVVENCQGTLERWIQAGAPAPALNEVRRFLEELIESQLERKMVTRELLAQDN
jgi:DNA repair protein RecO (recombination protein O)